MLTQTHIDTHTHTHTVHTHSESLALAGFKLFLSGNKTSFCFVSIIILQKRKSYCIVISVKFYSCFNFRCCILMSNNDKPTEYWSIQDFGFKILKITKI